MMSEETKTFTGDELMKMIKDFVRDKDKIMKDITTDELHDMITDFKGGRGFCEGCQKSHSNVAYHCSVCPKEIERLKKLKTK